MVSKNPAEAVGLTDRGVLEPAGAPIWSGFASMTMFRLSARFGGRDAGCKMVSALIERELLPRRLIRDGVFAAVVGLSGAGKDTVIGYARACLPTKPAELSGSSPVPVIRERGPRHAGRCAFISRGRRRLRVSLGARLRYGIPADIDRSVANGCAMPMFRSIILALRGRHANLAIVEVTAAPKSLPSDWRAASRGAKC